METSYVDMKSLARRGLEFEILIVYETTRAKNTSKNCGLYEFELVAQYPCVLIELNANLSALKFYVRRVEKKLLILLTSFLFPGNGST